MVVILMFDFHSVVNMEYVSFPVSRLRHELQSPGQLTPSAAEPADPLYVVSMLSLHCFKLMINKPYFIPCIKPLDISLLALVVQFKVYYHAWAYLGRV